MKNNNVAVRNTAMTSVDGCQRMSPGAEPGRGALVGQSR
jgi:hypothetical protein